MGLTVRDAARLLSTDENQVHRWIEAGEIPFDRAHDQLRLNRSELLEWATTRGARSGRVAWQYVQDLAGRLEVRLTRE